MNRILAVHTWGIGDWLFFSPVVNAIGDSFPSAKVDVVLGTPSVATLASFYPNVRVAGVANVARNPLSFLRLVLALRGTRYDALVFSAGVDSVKADWLSAIVRAEQKIALVRHRPLFLTRYMKLNPAEHRVEQNHKLAELLGVRVRRPSPAIPGFQQVNVTERSVLIHPGCDARSSFKRWPAQKFAIVAEALLRDHWRVTVLLGPEELVLAPAFKELLRFPQFRCVSGVPLREAVSLIASHEIVLNSDSGIGHVAAALDKTCLTLVGPGNPAAIRPYSDKAVLLSTATPPPCMPCVRPGGRYGCAEQPCMTTIQERDVISAIYSVHDKRSTATGR